MLRLPEALEVTWLEVSVPSLRTGSLTGESWLRLEGLVPDTEGISTEEADGVQEAGGFPGGGEEGEARDSSID